MPSIAHFLPDSLPIHDSKTPFLNGYCRSFPSLIHRRRWTPRAFFGPWSNASQYLPSEYEMTARARARPPASRTAPRFTKASR